MTDRRGFALITVLWLVAVLAVLLTAGLSEVHVSNRATENRIQETRALWAARGCLSLLQARGATDERITAIDSLALLPTVWCAAEEVSPHERVNPNLGDSLGLHRVLGDPVLVSSLLDWIDADDVARRGGAEADWYRERGRRLPRNGALRDAQEIRFVRGFEDAEPGAVDALFTARGEGQVAPNRASTAVLGSASVLHPGMAETLVALRRGGRTFLGPEAMVASIGWQPTIDEFTEVVRRFSFDDGEHHMRITGLAPTAQGLARSEITATMVALRERVAIRRLEVR